MECQEVSSFIFHVRGWACHIYKPIVHELTGVSGSAPFTAFLPCKSARVSSDADTLQGFMWQDTVCVRLAKLVKGYFNKVYAAAAGACHDCQAPDEPDVAEK